MVFSSALIQKIPEREWRGCPDNLLFCSSYQDDGILQHEGRTDLPREEIGPYGKGSFCFSRGRGPNQYF